MDLANGGIIFFVSLIAGFMGGQIGGGGLLNLPTLLLIGLDPLVALGTNRFAAIFYVFVSFFHYDKHKKVPRKNILLLGAVSLIGSIAGVITLFSLNIDSILLKKITIVVLLVTVIAHFFKKGLGLEDSDLKLTKKNWVLMIFLLFVITFYGGVFGMATTTLIATLFVLNKQSYLQAMSYSLILTVIVLISTSIVFIVNYQVNYAFAFVQAFGGVIGTIFGAKYAIKKGNAWIKNLTMAVIFILLLKLGSEVFF